MSKCQSQRLGWNDRYVVQDGVYDEVSINVECNDCGFKFIERYHLFAIENEEE